jgi:uncharacterized protein (TIGR00369 family)
MTDQPPSHVDQLTPGAALLGRELLGFDADGKTALIRFQARPDFANRHGTVLGGFLAAMLDSATGLTLLAGLPPDLTAVTTHLDTEFVKPAPIGTLLAKARVASRQDRDAVVEAEIFDPEGNVVARATAKLRIVRRK